MGEETEVRPADASMLISDIREDSCKTDKCGIHIVLQSDRGIWQLSLWTIFMLTALCCNWQTFSPAFLVPVSDCISVESSITNDSFSENRTKWISSSTTGNVQKVTNCFNHLMTNNCTGRSDKFVSDDDPDHRVITKCSPEEDGESWTVSNKKVAFHGTKYFIVAAKSVYMLGSLVAAIFVQRIVNRFGQRCTVFCGFLLFCLCSVAACFTASTVLFLALRFSLSLGITSVYWITLQAMLESVVPDYRLIYAVTGYLGWAVGYMILPVIAWFTTDWPSYQASISIPCLLLAVPLCFLPESANYLLLRGKVREAIEVLKAALRKNGQNTDDVSEMCLHSHRDIIKRTHESKENICLRLKMNLGYRNLLCYASSFMISLLYYILSWEFYLLPGDPFVTFGWAGAMETLAILLLIFLCYFLGQRLMLLLMVMSASVFLLAGMLVTAGEIWVPVHSYMAAKFFVSGAFVLTAIRGFEESSIAVTGAVMSIGAAVAPFMDEMVLDHYNTALMTSTCILCLILGILSALLPTRPTKYFLQNSL